MENHVAEGTRGGTENDRQQSRVRLEPSLIVTSISDTRIALIHCCHSETGCKNRWRWNMSTRGNPSVQEWQIFEAFAFEGLGPKNFNTR